MRRRARPDGLPFRLYERYGKSTYSIGYKSRANVWMFRLRCDVLDTSAIQRIRADAIHRAVSMDAATPPSNGFAALSAAFFDWQLSFAPGSEFRRAESTIAENRREACNLDKAFGKIDIRHLKKTHAYQYLDASEAAGRGPKANKEISLATTILEFGVRRGKLDINPFSGVRKLVTKPSTRLVTEDMLLFTLKVGRARGGIRHIAALALYTAYLCVRRPGEVLGLTRAQLREEGIHWTASKRKRGTAAMVGVIEWSPTLRATIDEALAVRRHAGAANDVVFGNLEGRRYTKGGWKKTLAYLMTDCSKAAIAAGMHFVPFNLQDCRPAGVTERLSNNDGSVLEATLHTSERMVRAYYDRRRTRMAKPTR